MMAVCILNELPFGILNSQKKTVSWALFALNCKKSANNHDGDVTETSCGLRLIKKNNSCARTI